MTSVRIVGYRSRVPRQLRIEYPKAIYHIINRGDRRELIFRDQADRVRFLETFTECCAKTGWQVHAYCLMPNHFHLVLETPLPNLVAGMKWFLGTYTARFNRKHKVSGHLFSGRYKSMVVDGSGTGYLRTVCEYVHLNPVRARLISPDKALESYVWSSYPEYLKTPSQRASWLRVDRLLGEMKIPQDSSAGRRQFTLQTEERRISENAKTWKSLRRTWCLGDDEFRKELLKHAMNKAGENHYAAERQEAAQAKAERIVREELNRLGWNGAELAARRKGDVEKVRIAGRLRAETTISLKWVAQRLLMGTWTHAANRLYDLRNRGVRK